MRIAKSVAELIGRTPMLELTHFEQTHCLNAHLLAKVESFNPGGSVKDRIALGMVEAAEKAGKLLPGGTIIEPTSGNTGIGLAMVAAARGYTAIIVMPDSMSVERRQLMLAYGAKLVLTPGKLGMKGAVAAPACRYFSWISRTVSGRVRASRSLQPLSCTFQSRNRSPR